MPKDGSLNQKNMQARLQKKYNRRGFKYSVSYQGGEKVKSSHKVILKTLGKKKVTQEEKGNPKQSETGHGT